ncbi:MAG: methylated-DNA--[protein]-cysteine S-methyltransferase [Alphaproteobacteria bacterium]|nr:methylated-DNA--[protein]-cysteine S-methyltransferase [Alphaproteobacteria bacterium]
MSSTFYTKLQSPLGDLLVISDGRFLTGLYLPNQKLLRQKISGQKISGQEHSMAQNDTHPFWSNVKHQLDNFFLKEQFVFDIPVRPKGTEFQLKVWKALQTISLGQILTYKELALMINHPKAVRAVGFANACNPISIVIPCHRVIGSNGHLTGYAGGLSNKQWLLNHEKHMIHSKEEFKIVA